jgi:hypothetical protein
MSNKTTKYLQTLKTNPTAKKERELVAQSQRAALQLEQDLLETRLAIDTAKEKLASQLSAVPFESKKIIAAQLEVEEFELGLERLNKLKTDLFTEIDEPAEDAVK